MSIEKSVKSNISESGEITRRPYKKDPLGEAFRNFESIKNGYVLPKGYKLEEGVSSYYDEDHIDEAREVYKIIKIFSQENDLTHLMNLDETQGISVEEAISQIEKNINFSEKINQQIKNNPIEEKIEGKNNINKSKWDIINGK